MIIPDTMTHIGERTFEESRLHTVTIGDNVTSIGDAAFRHARLASVSLGESVATIGSRAFEQTQLLRQITLPDSVESIGDRAFFGSSIERVNFGSGLRSIGDLAFAYSPIGRGRGPGTFEIPEGVTHIGERAFSNCTFIAHAILPEGLETLSEGLFQSSTSLRSVVIPESVTSIGERAFADCRQLTEINLGAAVGEIGARAFTGCDALEAISVSPGNSVFASFEGVLFDKDLTKLLRFPPGWTGDYRIPSETTEIAEEAFHGFRGEGNIFVPAGIRRIGDRAFAAWRTRNPFIYFEGDVPLELGEDIFAENERGVIRYFLGSQGWRDMFPEMPARPLSPPSLWSEASVDSTGLHHLDWFGVFLPFPFPWSNWLYNADLGWVYCLAETVDDIQIFFPDFRLWASLSATSYPWFYVHSPVESWVYLDSGGVGQRWFYHAGTDELRFENQLVWDIRDLAEMVYVEGGTIPSPSGLAVIEVDSFHIGKYEVTWKEWKRVRLWSDSNGYDIGDRGAGCSYNHPVHSINWYDAVKWCNAKSEMEGLTPVYTADGEVYRSGEYGWDGSHAVEQNLSATGYRLPLEAEWEFAARGGNLSQDYTYSGSNDLNAVGWYWDNSGGAACDLSSGHGTWRVGKKAANELGLYDMSGNVWEWCWDQSGSIRRIRGGSWLNGAGDCAVSNRLSIPPDYRLNRSGFRLARSSVQ